MKTPRRILAAISIVAFALLFGCGGGASPPSPTSPVTPTAPGQAAPAGAAAPKEFTVTAEPAARELIVKLISESPIWKEYFAQRLTATGATTPLVAVSATLERK